MKNTHKIAIIKTDTHFSSYGDDYDTLISKITDFEEVDSETYQLLIRYQSEYRYQILEQPIDQRKFIIDTVSNIKDRIKKLEEEKSQKKAQEEAKKEERALRKKAKDEAAEKKLLTKLIQKHGVPE